MTDTTIPDNAKLAKTTVTVLDQIMKRWSPRAFDSRTVQKSDLIAIFTAASWAASSSNEQPWRFVVGFRNDPVWASILSALAPKNQLWAKEAPVLLASFAKKNSAYNNTFNRFALHDLGAASAHLSLQATTQGLHTHGMAGFNEQMLMTSLGVPSDFEPGACWAVGYLGSPDSLPEDLRQRELQIRQRRPVADFVFGQWGESVL